MALKCVHVKDGKGRGLFVHVLEVEWQNCSCLVLSLSPVFFSPCSKLFQKLGVKCRVTSVTSHWTRFICLCDDFFYFYPVQSSMPAAAKHDIWQLIKDSSHLHYSCTSGRHYRGMSKTMSADHVRVVAIKSLNHLLNRCFEFFRHCVCVCGCACSVKIADVFVCGNFQRALLCVCVCVCDTGNVGDLQTWTTMMDDALSCNCSIHITCLSKQETFFLLNAEFLTSTHHAKQTQTHTHGNKGESSASLVNAETMCHR